jgi:MFS family permease
MMLGMFFCNFPHVLVGTQIKLLALENGASMQFATLVVSLYATGVVIGRIGSGIALDRIAPHLVAAVTLSLPAIGLLALASPHNAGWLLAGSIHAYPVKADTHYM